MLLDWCRESEDRAIYFTRNDARSWLIKAGISVPEAGGIIERKILLYDDGLRDAIDGAIEAMLKKSLAEVERKARDYRMP